MSTHLVTGHAGVGHISSDDAGRFNAGIFGRESYVLDTGTKFSYRLEGNNLIKIGSGDMIMQGRHINVPQNSETSFTIENGLPDKRRIDVIAMRYIKDVSTGIERAEMFLLKGTEVASSEVATPPQLTSGDIFAGDFISETPLYNIIINNVLIEDVESVFKVVPSIAVIDELLKHKADSIHKHSASDITSGTFSVNRIPNLTISKITNLQASLNAKQNNLGFAPIQQGGGKDQKDNKIYIGWTGQSLKAQVDTTDMGEIVTTGDANGAKLPMSKVKDLDKEFAKFALGALFSTAEMITKFHEDFNVSGNDNTVTSIPCYSAGIACVAETSSESVAGLWYFTSSSKGVAIVEIVKSSAITLTGELSTDKKTMNLKFTNSTSASHMVGITLLYRGPESE